MLETVLGSQTQTFHHGTLAGGGRLLMTPFDIGSALLMFEAT